MQTGTYNFSAGWRSVLRDHLASCCARVLRRPPNSVALLASQRLAAPEVPVLGTIPRFAAGRLEAALGGILDDSSFRARLTAIHERLHPSVGSGCRTILVTSAEAGEGKSTFALNFAASLAQRSRVMLVDADLRNPAISRRLNLPRYDAGLSELVSGDAPYRSCLALTGRPNLHAIRSGSLPEDPLAVLRNPRLAMTLRLSARYYDHIVIDSPALAAYPDATVLAKIADTVVLVVDAARRRFSRISGPVKLLKQVNAPIGGFVLNRALD